METFSDGVFAIAATLLVLEIGVGAHSSNLGHDLLHLWPSYLAYVTSFITIGIIWMNHHWVVATMARVDRVLLFLNLLLLMTVSFLPFPTRLVADYLSEPGEKSAAVAYAATLFVMAVVYHGAVRERAQAADRRRRSGCARARDLARVQSGRAHLRRHAARRVLQPARERPADVRDRGLLPAVSCALRALTRATPTPPPARRRRST